jgi:hypothetical protein
MKVPIAEERFRINEQQRTASRVRAAVVVISHQRSACFATVVSTKWPGKKEASASIRLETADKDLRFALVPSRGKALSFPAG